MSQGLEGNQRVQIDASEFNGMSIALFLILLSDGHFHLLVPHRCSRQGCLQLVPTFTVQNQMCERNRTLSQEERGLDCYR